MVGWHHQLNGHEFEQTPGDSEGQGSLVCCSPWGSKESDTTEWLNNNKMAGILSFLSSLKAHQLTIADSCNCWWLWHPLFTDTAGNIPFLIFHPCNCIPFHNCIYCIPWDPPCQPVSGRSSSKIPFERPLPMITPGTHSLRYKICIQQFHGGVCLGKKKNLRKLRKLFEQR